jgi:hypothetical protein
MGEGSGVAEMSTEMTPEVFTLVDRMAAAFMREDVHYARELVNEFRRRCESDGRREERRSLERRAADEMQIFREGDAWFVTKDGLRTKDRIKDSRGYLPVWQLHVATSDVRYRPSTPQCPTSPSRFAPTN